MRPVQFSGLILAPIGLALTLSGTARYDKTQTESLAPTRLVTASEGNKVRYRVREQLAGVDFPSDAVGETADVTGAIVIADDGSVVEGSKFVVNPATLKTDAERRDGFVRRNTLQTETHPSIELVPKSLKGLSGALPASGDVTLELFADLTIRGVTKPTTWQVKAKADKGTFSGTASTAFTFEEFQLTKPRIARVLSVADTIRLEYDFRLVTDPASR